MSQNLLELVQNYFVGDTVRQTGTALGENESSIGTALKSVVPLVLGGLFARSQQPGGTADLFGMAQQAHGNNILGNLGSLLGGTGDATAARQASEGGLLNKGTEMIRSVFGNQYAPAVEAVGQQAGVSSSTVGKLMSMAVPVVLGLLGRHASQNNLDERGFGSYLNDQRGGIMGALGSLPGNLGGMLSGLGLGAASAVGGTLTNATQPMSNTVSSAAREVGQDTREVVRDTGSAVERATSPARWPWLLLLLLGLGALWYFMSNRTRTPESVTPAVTEAPTNTAVVPAAATGRYDEASGNYIYEVGSPTELKLADGTMLNVGANSTESRLYNFLNDASMSVNETDKTQGWMSFDRLYFATGKATLTAESQAQLRNVASILKAFPNAAIKLGGYTDNTGKADANVLLSADRANAAMSALKGMGINAARVQAEGYGQEHPIASNDTPEGRAQNRRIDVRVTRK